MIAALVVTFAATAVFGLAAPRLSDALPPARTTWLMSAGGLLVLAGALTCGAGCLIRRGRSTVAAYRLSRSIGGGELAVLDHVSRSALAVPRRPGRIVATSGMLRRLDGAQRRALLAHERAHLRHRHHLHHSAAALAGAAPRPQPRRIAVLVVAVAVAVALAAVGYGMHGTKQLFEAAQGAWRAAHH